MARSGRRSAAINVDDGSVARTNLSAAFGRQLRESRLNQGISQEELAARANLDRTFVGRVERGEFRITLENAEALAVACGSSLRMFLNQIHQE